MKIYRGFSDKRLKTKKRCIAIGIFDGVHRGHASILHRVVRGARRLKATPAVLTFDPHPRKVLSGDRKNPPILMSLEHRLRVIASLGIREVVVVHFEKKFSRVTREAFLERDLVGRLGAKMLGVGHDFRFGRFARGNAAYLRSRSRALGFKLSVCAPVKRKGRIISSTAIRRAIETGRLERARDMLGRPVSVYGTVVHGHGRGARIGFPTANLDPHHETLPPEGVWAVYGDLEGARVRGVLHIGPKPTFGEGQKSVEVHLLGRRGSLYGKEIELFFLKRLRPIRRFENARSLSYAIGRDVARARRVFSLQRPF